jgi:hypothetical protein
MEEIKIYVIPDTFNPNIDRTCLCVNFDYLASLVGDIIDKSILDKLKALGRSDRAKMGIDASRDKYCIYCEKKCSLFNPSRKIEGSPILLRGHYTCIKKVKEGKFKRGSGIRTSDKPFVKMMALIKVNGELYEQLKANGTEISLFRTPSFDDSLIDVSGKEEDSYLSLGK